MDVGKSDNMLSCLHAYFPYRLGALNFLSLSPAAAAAERELVSVCVERKFFFSLSHIPIPSLA